MNKLLQLIAALALGFAAVDNAAGQSKPAENPIIWADGMQTRTITLANLDKFSHIAPLLFQD